jgi:hypothetical protein
VGQADGQQQAVVAAFSTFNYVNRSIFSELRRPAKLDSLPGSSSPPGEAFAAGLNNQGTIVADA